MQITILTTGSRGDVQPYLALGVGLQQAGHQVRLVTHAPFAAWIESYGLEFVAMGGDVQAVMASEAGKRMLEAKNPLTLIRRYQHMIEPLLAEAIADSWAACQGSEAIIATAYTIWGFDCAQKLGVPFYLAALMPMSANPEFVFPSLPPTLNLGRWLNSLTYPLALEGFGLAFRHAINQFRQNVLQFPALPLGTGVYGRLERAKIPVLYGYSSTVVPKPANWSDRLQVNGYWFLDRPHDWAPPTDLQDFLAAGSPPVYIGFGSMTGRDPERMTEIALAALAQTQQRGILATGWGGIQAQNLPETVFPLTSIPHDWLFPQMAAIVHHGGAGTSAAALRAGVPSVVVPFFGDQPFWGHRLMKLGVSPAPIPKADLTVEKLSQAIAIALTPALRQQAQQIGKQIQSEQGVERAVEFFHHSLNLPRPAPTPVLL